MRTRAFAVMSWWMFQLFNGLNVCRGISVFFSFLFVISFSSSLEPVKTKWQLKTCVQQWQHFYLLTLWRPLLPYGYSYKASCAPRPGYAVICNFDLRALRRSALSVRVPVYCRQQFSFNLPSVLWVKRVSAFNLNFDNNDNLFCKLCSCL